MRIRDILIAGILLVTPLTSAGSAETPLGRIGEAVFSGVEKQLIEEFFGRSATPAERILIDAAKDAVIGGPSSSSRQEDETDDDKDDDKDWGKSKHKNKHKGQGRGQGKNKANNKGRSRDKGLPPGLAKKRRLPPGLRKRLAKHGSLPPGLAKREIPADLDTRLPPPPPGTERVIVGGDVALVDIATNVVLDILYDVVTRSK